MKLLQNVRHIVTATIIGFLPFIASADPQILHYGLSSQNRLEIHLSENNDRPMEIYLFDSRYTEPLSVPAFERPVKLSLIRNSEKKLRLPLPDNGPMIFPDWIEIDTTDSTRRNLKEEGMLIIREREGDVENVGIHMLRIFPLAFILKHLNPVHYFVPDVTRLDGFRNRHYSVALPENARFEDIAKQSLLMSVVDTNDKSEMRVLGTVLMSHLGVFQYQTAEWTDFLSVGKKIEFSSEISLGRSVLIDGQPWGRRIDGTANVPFIGWPGYKDKQANRPGTFQAPQPSEERQMQLGYRLQQLTPNYIGPLHKKPTGMTREVGKDNLIDPRVQENKEQIIEMDLRDQHLDHDMARIEKLVKNSMIANDLERTRTSSVRYHVKELQSVGQTKQYVVLTAFVKNANGSKRTDSWVLGLDSKTDKVLELFKLPRANTVHDIRLLPFGNLMLKDGTFVLMKQKTISFRCHKAHL